MEAEELITKIKDLPRKNQIRVALTEKGRNAYNKAVKRESIHNIMSALSAEGEQRQMAAFLKKIQQRAQLQLTIDAQGKNRQDIRELETGGRRREIGRATPP